MVGDTSRVGQQTAVLEDSYRDMEGSSQGAGIALPELLDSDGAGEFLPAQFRGRPNTLFTPEANAAFERRIGGMSDPNEVTRAMLDRAREGGLISNDAYDRIVKGEDQSAEAIGRALWESVTGNAQRLVTAGGDDPRSINARITSEYWARFSERPSAYWMALGTLASNQVGFGLLHTGSLAAFGSADAATVYGGLTFGNQTIAMDMLPLYDVYDKLGGYKALETIAPFRLGLDGKPNAVPPEALQGYRLLSEGESLLREGNGRLAHERFTDSLKALALHEQKNIAQTMYDRPFAGQVFKDAANRFNASRFGAMLSLNVAGVHVMFNDVLRQTPMAQRDIGNLDQRMTFVNRAADTFSFLMQTTAGQERVRQHVQVGLGVRRAPLYSTPYDNPSRQRL